MPYSFITYVQLRQQLANRLSDTGDVFWTDDEKKVLVTEAMRTFGVLSGFWRERGTFVTAANTAFYDLPANLTPAGLVDYTVTDRDIIKSLQYNLLESVASQSAWSGTEMFALDDLTQAIYRRTNQFLSDTGIIVTRSTMNTPPPPIGRVSLADNIIDVRRVAWLDSGTRYYQLWRDDEYSQTAYDPSWEVTPTTPMAYSVMATQPVELQLAPIPIVGATLELLAIQAQPAITPATSATILTMFDDLTPFIKWGGAGGLAGL